MIRQRVRAGLSVVKDKLARDGKFASKAGVMRTKLGRPGAEPDKIERGTASAGQRASASARWRDEIGLGVGTVHRLKRETGVDAAG